ncbi:hypothetical protein F2Q70_00009187 [Brassica cretica]|uniref:Uncharacterized protein n=1 Tax=Brassica cretica TaxID=69181 RepID=A0A8S9M3L2_BRACR|nr:hypothetical protein F2Q70_00009187 [Brassica cretica]
MWLVILVVHQAKKSLENHLVVRQLQQKHPEECDVGRVPGEEKATFSRDLRWYQDVIHWLNPIQNLEDNHVVILCHYEECDVGRVPSVGLS